MRKQNMQNTLKATQTIRQLLRTMQVQNNVLPTKSQNMHLHTRAQNNRNQIFTECDRAHVRLKKKAEGSRGGAAPPAGGLRGAEPPAIANQLRTSCSQEEILILR